MRVSLRAPRHVLHRRVRWIPNAPLKPIRRRFRRDSDARDLLTGRPTGQRGRTETWWS